MPDPLRGTCDTCREPDLAVWLLVSPMGKTYRRCEGCLPPVALNIVSRSAASLAASRGLRLLRGGRAAA
jgi:hypothetical protein